jgi:phosphoribosyl-AMP cyclohydrolase
VLLDCDGDSVLLRVRPGGDGGACHLGRRSCFAGRLELVDGEPAAPSEA